MTHQISEPALAPLRPFPLVMAGEGSHVMIVELAGGHRFRARLSSLGLNQGSELEVVHRLGGKTVVKRGDCKLALGAGMAQKVMVAVASKNQA